MDKLKHLKNLAWCKLDWESPKNLDNLVEPSHDDEFKHYTNDVSLEEIMEKSEEFPVPFPIETVRIKTLKETVSEDVLKRNINSTYPLVHWRVHHLMEQFLKTKRKFGSEIEKALYKKMTVAQLIDRILLKRAMNFMTKHDKYMLITGEKGAGNWESIGTPTEREPLVLSKCLSYDELKLSAMLFVSSYTACVNDGARKNKGLAQGEGVETDAVIVGVIGPRFTRENRMDCEDILVTALQNREENGYGELKDNAKCAMRKLWTDFFATENFTYKEASSKLTQQTTKLKKEEKQMTDRFVSLKEGAIFDNEVYHKRLSIIAETSLIEANSRAFFAKKNSFLNVIGAGLGVWKMSTHQNDVFVLSFIDRVRAMLKQDALSNVTDVNFAYIKVTRTLKAYFQMKGPGVLHMFIKSEDHPKGGINIYLEDREPSSKLTGEHAGKLLVMTYPWDGNAHPGNEFWLGKLGSSGDPAAACSTQIAELHNAYINRGLLGECTRVAHTTALVFLNK